MSTPPTTAVHELPVDGSRPTSRWLPPVFGVTATAVVAAFLLAPDAWADWVYLAGVTVASVLVVAFVARRPHLRPCRWIAASVVLTTIGDWGWSLQELTGIESVGWYGLDVAYFAAYGALLVGLLLLGRQREPVRLVDRLVELWSTAVVVALVAWLAIMEPIASDVATAWPDRLIALGYPVCDAALITMVVWLFLVRSRRETARLVVLGLGVAGWLVADVGYLVLVQQDAYSFGAAKVLDGGWLIGSLLLVFACLLGDRERPGKDRAVRQGGSGWVRVAIGSTLVAVPFIADAIADIGRGESPPAFAVGAAAAALTVLAVVRAVSLKRGHDRTRALLMSRERRARALAANSSDVVMVLDVDGLIMAGDDDLHRILERVGVEPGASAFGAVHEDDRERAEHLLRRCAATPGQLISDEFRLTLPGRPSRWYALRAVNLLDDPDVGGLVVNLQDVHDRKQVEEELVHRAFFDSLTGLANRALFHDRVAHELEKDRAAGTPCAVLFIDLDGFKNVNDTLGHDVGDELIKWAASKLRAATPAQCTVARLGGDEFGILVESHTDSAAAARQIAEDAMVALREEVVLAGERRRCTASIGIAVAQPGSDRSSLLRDADLAMYQAKAAGKARWTEFDAVMEADARERLQIERDLDTALDDGQFEVVYQPVVNLATRRIRGFEALLRWTHPELGPIGPDRFVPIAEETGTIIPIGAWVLEQACQTMAGWNQEFPHDPPLTIAVNVSARQLNEPGFDSLVRRTLASTGLDERQLVLEITETSLISHPEAMAACLDGLRHDGVKLALDDFGTGYSSISYLRQLPVDIVKIDREFTQATGEADGLPAIVKGLLDLSRALGLDVVAEGIETEAQLDGLTNEHCPAGQGWYFDAALRRDAAEARLAASYSPSLSGGGTRSPRSVGGLHWRSEPVSTK
jgi:diguanylate cyclase (GGDEF)-like protein